MRAHPQSSEPRTALIVTGDDFGSSTRVNEAVEQAFEAGWLKQTSLIVTGAAVDEAARIARRHPGLVVGLHLTLCWGYATRRSRLTNSARFFFPRRPGFAGLRYAFDPFIQRELQREIAAQFDRFRSLDLGTEYWDGHCHLHLHPTILDLTLPLATDFRFTRLVYTSHPKTFREVVWNAVSRHARPKLKAHRISHAQQVLGLERSGRMDTEGFVSSINQIPSGALAEIYYHPGAESGSLDMNRLYAMVAAKNISLCSVRTLAR
jgi:predicted glycoside hydrolase/deacetylase ChbG (UPF0249 family)